MVPFFLLFCKNALYLIFFRTTPHFTGCADVLRQNLVSYFPKAALDIIDIEAIVLDSSISKCFRMCLSGLAFIEVEVSQVIRLLLTTV